MPLDPYQNTTIDNISGVIGQILRDTGNPVFETNDGATGAAAALRLGLQLAKTDLGLENKKVAQQAWSWDNVGFQYKILFDELLSLRSQATNATPGALLN